MCSIYGKLLHIVLFRQQYSKKIWLRISLSNILAQVQTPTIKRCHRSYIINLGKVKNIKGNAQGYKLTLPEIDFDIPVSRSFISIIIPQLLHLKR
ncbi:LytTR family transcriptional regulator DNA-binding domain-containing protein [Chryseobacterium jejuense]|uniref:LytTR family transcriptional regulator DNA-binding domain-containing protein n=1 Tax=Chryseobacterium jejuense TaxID=445960 RepID=UPI000B7EFF7C